jgi:hypothetical protein
MSENWFQASKHEEKLDENLGSNPVEVHAHDLVSVCLLSNIGKIETFKLFLEELLSYILHALCLFKWLHLPKKGFRRASMKRKLMTFQAAVLSRFTRTVWLVLYATLGKLKSLLFIAS